MAAWVLLALAPVAAGALLGFASYYGDHMVLQKEPAGAVVWGYGPSGTWTAVLEPMAQGGPYELTAAQGLQNATLQDVYFGDVWLCSGQSNMAMTVLQVGTRGLGSFPAAGRAGQLLGCCQLSPRSPMPAGSWLLPLATPTSASSPRLLPAPTWSCRTWSASTCPGPSPRLQTWATATSPTSRPSAGCWAVPSTTPGDTPWGWCRRPGRGPPSRLGPPGGLCGPVGSWRTQGASCRRGRRRPRCCGTPWSTPCSAWRCAALPGTKARPTSSCTGSSTAAASPRSSPTGAALPTLPRPGRACPCCPSASCSCPPTAGRALTIASRGCAGTKRPTWGWCPTPGCPTPSWPWPWTWAMSIPPTAGECGRRGPGPQLELSVTAASLLFLGSIHPRDKQTVALRLQLGARAVAYGERSLVFQGPYPARATLEVTKGLLNVTYSQELLWRRRDAAGFEVRCSSQRGWVPAPVVAVGSRTVTLALAGCGPLVLGLRYAWAEWPCDYQACALYNSQGLPAPPFLLDTSRGASGRAQAAGSKELLLLPSS
ncbi:sialate O-acetylesterase isoform X2 [Pogoniulus pusillus]|uniref:sialate O-acetylesterase isoform X2 n=1 Tax=Pogoniulus pusillus TaxID=488313 RepID=UPI0030B9A2F6